MSRFKNKNLALICLIFIFVLLLLQSAILLFIDSPKSEGLSQMDIIFRTTLSSLFGYFISSNYSKRSSESKNNAKKTIGFIENKSDSNLPLMKNEEVSTNARLSDEGKLDLFENKKSYTNLQIIFLSAVCIFCLIIMMIVRNFSHMLGDDTYALVTLSMYRDFISSSIGAIIGLNRGSDNKDKS